jgi:hypothetical protein
VEETDVRLAKIVLDDNISGETNSFKHLGYNVSVYDMNMDFEENVKKHSTLNDCVKRYFAKSTGKEIQVRVRNSTAKPALQCGSETCGRREEKSKENRRILNKFSVTTVRYLSSLLLPAHAGSSLADFSTMKMEAIRSSETSVHFTGSTRRHIPEDGILHNFHHCHILIYTAPVVCNSPDQTVLCGFIPLPALDCLQRKFCIFV